MSSSIDFTPNGANADLDVRWIHGHSAGQPDSDPPIQVHAVDAHTVILRQSKAVHYEAPFMYLLFGNDRAILFDTGATADERMFPLRGTVDELLERWLLKHPRQTYELVVAHTHAHGDHVAGDVQFADRPLTTIVPAALDGLRGYFAFTDWPGGIVAFDLGGRRIELIGCPGHHETSIAIFDPWTGFLLTGDTVYRGRLFVSDMAAYAATVDRLVSFADDRRATHLMGGHIEMTRRPGRDYPMGAVYQPDEPPLQMSPTQLGDLRDAVASIADRRGAHSFADFIVVNRPGIGTISRLVARSMGHRLGRLRRMGRRAAP